MRAQAAPRGGAGRARRVLQRVYCRAAEGGGRRAEGSELGTGAGVVCVVVLAAGREAEGRGLAQGMRMR